MGNKFIVTEGSSVTIVRNEDNPIPDLKLGRIRSQMHIEMLGRQIQNLCIK